MTMTRRWTRLRTGSGALEEDNDETKTDYGTGADRFSGDQSVGTELVHGAGDPDLRQLCGMGRVSCPGNGGTPGGFLADLGDYGHVGTADNPFRGESYCAAAGGRPFLHGHADPVPHGTGTDGPEHERASAADGGAAGAEPGGAEPASRSEGSGGCPAVPDFQRAAAGRRFCPVCRQRNRRTEILSGCQPEKDNRRKHRRTGGQHGRGDGGIRTEPCVL